MHTLPPGHPARIMGLKVTHTVAVSEKRNIWAGWLPSMLSWVQPPQNEFKMRSYSCLILISLQLLDPCIKWEGKHCIVFDLYFITMVYGGIRIIMIHRQVQVLIRAHYAQSSLMPPSYQQLPSFTPMWLLTSDTIFSIAQSSQWTGWHARLSPALLPWALAAGYDQYSFSKVTEVFTGSLVAKHSHQLA